MSFLKTALKKIKKSSEVEFKYCYDLLVEQYIDEDEVEDEEWDFSTYKLDVLDEALSNISVIQIEGMTVTHKGVEKQLFPHPSYGWDGGNSISTSQFNLITLASNDFGGGPTAKIVCLKNPDYPGLALHYNPDLSEIHIYT